MFGGGGSHCCGCAPDGRTKGPGREGGGQTGQGSRRGHESPGLLGEGREPRRGHGEKKRDIERGQRKEGLGLVGKVKGLPWFLLDLYSVENYQEKSDVRVY